MLFYHTMFYGYGKTSNRELEELEHKRERENKQQYYRANKQACAQATRNALLNRKYGINQEIWDLVFELQGRRCAICKTTEPGGRGWQTDHDHNVEQGFREILCSRCNMGLGYFRDNPAICIAAAVYLRTWKQILTREAPANQLSFQF